MTRYVSRESRMNGGLEKEFLQEKNPLWGEEEMEIDKT